MELFYEQKANLTLDNVRALADAGVTVGAAGHRVAVDTDPRPRPQGG